MSYFVVDVESDGGLLGVNSMVCFGAVLIDPEGKLDKTFYGQTAPLTDIWEVEALSISGFSREEHENFPHPEKAMLNFGDWVLKNNGKGRPVLISDNNGYDASWINYYFLLYGLKNPFGWSSRRIGDMYAGFMNDTYYRWKQHRKSEHTHHPVDDAKGNAEALLHLKSLGFKISFK
jgi:hypothetical protein